MDHKILFRFDKFPKNGLQICLKNSYQSPIVCPADFCPTKYFRGHQCQVFWLYANASQPQSCPRDELIPPKFKKQKSSSKSQRDHQYLCHVTKNFASPNPKNRIKEPQGHDLTFCLNTLHELYEKNSLRPSHTEMSITEEQFAFLIGSLSKGPFDEAQLTKSLNFFCSIREPEY